MKLDLVHDIQKAYRKILNAMSRPGTIEDISNEANKVDIEINLYKGTIIAILMLLDTEVAFNVIRDEKMIIGNRITELTYAVNKNIEDADFVVVRNKWIQEGVKEAFEKGKVGTLIDPNKSSTIIAEVESLEEIKNFKVSGPGIKDNKLVFLPNGKWVEAREEANFEYPLGIDIIFIDKNSKVMALPRTTKLIRGEE